MTGDGGEEERKSGGAEVGGGERDAQRVGETL